MSTMEKERLQLKLINMADIEEKKVHWLWYPYIPFGKLTIIQGDPGEGKTTCMLNLVALLTKGEKLPCDSEVRPPINCIYQTAEDGLGDTIKPRLLAAGADCSKILVIDESRAALFMTDERLEEAIQKTHASLVILDPIQAYLGVDVDMHRANEIRPILKHLAEVAEKYNCAIVLIGHMNKANAMKSTYRGLGSIDFQATARSVLIVARLKDNPTVRIMAHDKSSLAPEGKPIAFELNKEEGFRWIGHFEITIEELLSGVKVNKPEKAEELLKDMLSDGRKLQAEVLERAQRLDISKRVLDQVKKDLGVKSYKSGSQWYWQLG